MRTVGKFLWKLFSKRLGWILELVLIKAAQTDEVEWYEKAVKWGLDIGRIFFPTHVAVWSEAEGGEAGGDWINLEDDDISEITRGIGAIAVKDMFTDEAFLVKSGLTRDQAERTLIAAITWIKPEAVDTEEEVARLSDKVKALYPVEMAS